MSRHPHLTAVAAVGLLVSGSAAALEPNTLTFALTPVTSTIVFHPPAPEPNPSRAAIDPNFSIGNGRKIAIGDFNGDGLKDMVIGPSYGRFKPKLTLQFWINQGAGRFADAADTVENGPVEIGATWPLIADFNRDGRDDIFVVDYGLEDKLPTQGFDGGKNHILLSQPSGRLRDLSSTNLPDEPSANNHPSNMADLNGDGAMDVLLQRLGGLVVPGQGTALKMNDGSGKFIETIKGLPRQIAYLPRTEANTVPDRQAAGTVGACDLDGNGRNDLVTASYTNQSFARNVRMFEQSADGTFTERFKTPLPQEIIDAAAQRTSLGVGAAGIVCADLNGDRLGDVIVHWETDTNTTYIQFLKNAGGWRFEDVTLDWFGRWETHYAVRNTERGLAGVSAYDVNGDGTLDFVPKTWGAFEPTLLFTTPFAYLNDGTGKLTPLTYRGTNPSVTAAMLGSAIGCPGFCSLYPLLFDATGDGKTDLVLLDVWTYRSSDAPVREDRVLVHVLAGEHNVSGAAKSRPLFWKP
jgi:hypothetical protein